MWQAANVFAVNNTAFPTLHHFSQKLNVPTLPFPIYRTQEKAPESHWSLLKTTVTNVSHLCCYESCSCKMWSAFVYKSHYIFMMINSGVMCSL